MRRIAALFAITAILAVAGTTSAHAETLPSNQTQPVMVTVERGDSLSKIATRFQTTYPRLYDANPAIQNPDLIYPGQTLRVPMAGEQLAGRPLPANAPAAAHAQKALKTSAKAASPKAAAAKPKSVAAAKPKAVAAIPVTGGSTWDKLAQCESGGRWNINTGNSYYGGLQFTLATWRSVGGSGYPHQASREEQIKRAEILLARSGWGQWPACTRKLGLR